MIDRKGIVSFLLITFGLTYAIEASLILSGFRITGSPAGQEQCIIIALMWVPTLATIITVRCITHEEFDGTFLKLGSWKPYLTSGLIVPLCFGIIYGLGWLLGLGQPDFSLQTWRVQMLSNGVNPSSIPTPGKLSLIRLFIYSLTVTTLVNSLFAFGEECGWRGYLLPKLLPLGRVRAHLYLGLIWGLWHAPLILIGLNYPGYPLLGIIFFIAVTTAVGIFINELTLYYHNAILASWIHGVFNSQAYGIWRIIFPSINPLLGGFTGLTGISVWIALAWLTMAIHAIPRCGLRKTEE